MARAGEKAHRAALELDPKRDSLHNNLGYNLLQQGKAKEAAAEFREALKLKPDSEVARNKLGMALAADPDPAGSNDAILHWQSVSDPATAHSNMAALLIRQKRYAGSAWRGASIWRWAIIRTTQRPWRT